MMVHFGKNPVRGGSPPVDSRIRAVMGINAGVLFHVSDMELIVVDELVWRIINIGVVSIM